jgi:hypothetical protein
MNYQCHHYTDNIRCIYTFNHFGGQYCYYHYDVHQAPIIPLKLFKIPKQQSFYPSHDNSLEYES